MEEVFSETLKIAKLILTLPSTAATVKFSFLVLRWVINYILSTMREERLFNVMLIAVEEELLQTMMKTSTFLDDIIDAFGEFHRLTYSFALQLNTKCFMSNFLYDSI